MMIKTDMLKYFYDLQRATEPHKLMSRMQRNKGMTKTGRSTCLLAYKVLKNND